jgi:hypothetical protein
VSAEELVREFRSLAPWTSTGTFGAAEWASYRRVANLVRHTGPDVVAEALDRFVRETREEEFPGYEPESSLFLLMRVLFDLPEAVPEELRVSYKGWVNWPAPDEHGLVSLAWPISWAGGSPELVARYEGSEGRSYAAGREYRRFLDRFPYRELDDGGTA